MAYFIGRIELLEWINSLTGLGYTKIEQTASGIVACHAFDALYPGVVRMDKVNYAARRDFEWTENYKVLQEAFSQLGIDKRIPVPELIRGKRLDNLEFMQWVKGHFDEHAGDVIDSYDAAAVREQYSKSGCTGTTGKRVAPKASRPKNIGSATSTKATRPKPGSRSTATSRARANATKASTKAAPVPARARKVTPGNQTTPPPEETVPKAEADALRGEIAELDRLLQEGDNEREFYFGKLRDIEGILQDLDEQYQQEELDELLVEVVRLIKQVLYADGAAGNSTRPDNARENAEPNEGPAEIATELDEKLALQ